MLDENKVSAVHYAARHNHLDVLRLLVRITSSQGIRNLPIERYNKFYLHYPLLRWSTGLT